MRAHFEFPPPLRVAGLVVALLAAFAGGSVRAGDPVVARTLLENGRKAVNGRKYDEGVTLLRKALQEDPALAEAAYWIAVAREKSKDAPGALAGYREFLAILDRKGAAATAEEKKLLPQAAKRVDALAAGEKEFQKLEDRYVEELLSFARERRPKDPAASLAAVELLLAVRPKHEEAHALLRQLDPSAVDEGPFGRVAEWTDYIAKQLIRVEGASHAGGILTIDAQKGRRYKPDATVELGTDYAMEGEFRVVSPYEQRWMAGLCFSETKDTVYIFGVRRAEVTLDLAKNAGGGRPESSSVASLPMEVLDAAAWHRVGVVVRGRLIQCWLDGKMVLERQDDERADLAGIAGAVQIGCKVEWRVLRAGRL